MSSEITREQMLCSVATMRPPYLGMPDAQHNCEAAFRAVEDGANRVDGIRYTKVFDNNGQSPCDRLFTNAVSQNDGSSGGLIENLIGINPFRSHSTSCVATDGNPLELREF